jgi:hypothetical protein
MDKIALFCAQPGYDKSGHGGVEKIVQGHESPMHSGCMVKNPLTTFETSPMTGFQMCQERRKVHLGKQRIAVSSQTRRPPLNLRRCLWRCNYRGDE